MKQIIKNIGVGFLVSFIGSIPLGYLNIVGYDVFKKAGFNQTVLYLLGVVTIEFLVIYLTLIFADKLTKNKRLIKYIEAFSIVFMFVLAYLFYSNSSSESTQASILDNYLGYSYYLIGVFLSVLNFIQIPFWLSWNLYLLNARHIDFSTSPKFIYAIGTIVGTFSGMLVLILSLNYVTQNVDFLSKYLMKIIIPLVFIGLGIYQSIAFYKKNIKY